MKAAFITQTGPPEAITYGELPAPKPARNQCLIKVAAVDVNPIDTYIRSGAIPAKLSFPYILGRDLAGTVAEVGTGVKRLRAGEVLFVNGGSGGVGSCVVQMAKLLGARVVTTAGTDQKVRICRELGADLMLNYKTQNVDAAIKDFAPEGVDVWWETLREPDFERSIPLLRLRGRMVVMAGRDARPPFPVGPFYTRDCSLHGFAMFNATAREQRVAAQDINRWSAEGKLRARIDRILPLSDAATAHRLQEESTIHKSGALAGKIVLQPEQTSGNG